MINIDLRRILGTYSLVMVTPSMSETSSNCAKSTFLTWFQNRKSKHLNLYNPIHVYHENVLNYPTSGYLLDLRRQVNLSFSQDKHFNHEISSSGIKQLLSISFKDPIILIKKNIYNSW